VKSSSLLLALGILITLLCGCQDERSEPLQALPATPRVQGPLSPVVSGAAEYKVRETLTLVNNGPGQPEKQNLWLALIRDLPPYQTVRSMEIEPDRYQLITDEYGNEYAEFDLADMPPGTRLPIQVRYRVEVNELRYDLEDCDGEVPDAFNQPELHVESKNPQIVELAQQLSEGQQTACQQARAFYDYVGNNLVYSINDNDWGAQAALGPMGADCTEYASLMIALSRAAGIPARYLEGLRVLGEGAEEGARVEHAWLEVYLPSVGWTPMDPTLGRSSLNREEYFAHLPADHIVVTVGRNPSTLRGASYWTHLYWPGPSTEIRVEQFEWLVTPVSD
jgi:transglutaminase-like putative cysteine protease